MVTYATRATALARTPKTVPRMTFFAFTFSWTRLTTIPCTLHFSSSCRRFFYMPDLMNELYHNIPADQPCGPVGLETPRLIR